MQEFFITFFLKFYRIVIFTTVVECRYVNHNMLTFLLFYTLCQVPEFWKNSKKQTNQIKIQLASGGFPPRFVFFDNINTYFFEKSFVEFVNITVQ